MASYSEHKDSSTEPKEVSLTVIQILVEYMT